MKQKYKSLSIALVIAVIVSVFQIALPSETKAATGVNLVVNGGFETDATSDWMPDSWTFSSSNVSWYDTNNGRSGNALKIQSTGTDSIETVSQTVYGSGGNRLPDGVYTLEAYVKGGEALASLNSFSLSVTNTGVADKTSSSITASSLSSTDYTCVKLENVKVNNGQCKVVLSSAMNSTTNWKVVLYLDDISFYKTGELNYVNNGSFEGDGSGGTAGWNISTIASTQSTGNWGSAGENSYCMKLWDANAYTGTLSQAVTGLPDGEYTLEGWIKGSGSNAAKMYAGSTTGDAITLTDSFSKVTIAGIKVTSGSLDIGFSYDMQASGWINIDDVTLYKTRGLNCVSNGDFEAGWTPTDWTVTSPAITCKVSGWDHTFKTADGKKLEISAWGNAGTYDVAAAQNVTGLPDGVYNLDIWVNGGSTINSLALTAGANSSSNLKDSLAGDYTKLTLSDIEVKSGECAIGLTAQLLGTASDGGWLNIDDVDFYKVREIGDKAAIITAIAPVSSKIQVNETDTAKLKAVLPAKVTVTYDDGSTSQINVTWDAIDPASYTGADKVGTSFKVNGAVANTDIKALAAVNVTHRTMDLNGDSTINVGDIGIVSSYWGSTSSSSNWASAKSADINGDNAVNIDDLKLIGDYIINN